MKNDLHTPVLLQEVLEVLRPKSGEVLVDATLGLGGHSKAICRSVNGDIYLIGIDQDGNTLNKAKNILKDSCSKVEFIKGNFRDIRKILSSLKVSDIDMILFDLGMSSLSLESSGRGFSFQKDEPLLMTYNEDAQGLTAGDLINSLSAKELTDIFEAYGDERFSKKIALGIVEARKEKVIETSKELAEIVWLSVPRAYRRRKTHPATKIFQALRIAVNNELETIKEGVNEGLEILSTNGRIAVITFHSLEDRMIKRIFKEKVDSKNFSYINKKPIAPTREEIKQNPRARSAKLRGIRKTAHSDL